MEIIEGKVEELALTKKYGKERIEFELRFIAPSKRIILEKYYGLNGHRQVHIRLLAKQLNMEQKDLRNVITSLTRRIKNSIDSNYVKIPNRNKWEMLFEEYE